MSTLLTTGDRINVSKARQTLSHTAYSCRSAEKGASTWCMVSGYSSFKKEAGPSLFAILSDSHRGHPSETSPFWYILSMKKSASVDSGVD